MDAGGRDQIVAFERETRVVDAGGGAAATWVEIGQAWAAVKWIGGAEQTRQGAVRATQKYRFTLLSAAADELALTTSDRIRWDGALFNIRERPRRLASSTETEIIAETGVTQ